MTALKNRKLYLFFALLLAATLLFTLAPPASATATNKLGTFNGMYYHFTQNTEGRAPDGGSNCAEDMTGYSLAYRQKVCSLKVMGLWSGNKFYPQSAVKRKQLAGWIRKMTQYANSHYPSWVTQRTTKASNVGYGHNIFCDVGAQWVSTQEDVGMGFMQYWHIDNGFAGSCSLNRDYHPGQNSSAEGVTQRLNAWDNLVD